MASKPDEQTIDSSRLNRHAALIGLFIVVAAVAFHLLPAGISRSYDWGLQAAWIERFYLQLSTGTYWPQWIHEADGGRGQPVFVFYPPLVYWLASAFRAFSGDAVLALKLTELTSVGILYCSSLALFRRLCGQTPAAALAVATSLSPAVLFLALRMHMLGATLALAAFPWILIALISDRRGIAVRVAMLSLAIAFIGWNHLMSLMMSCLLAVAIALQLVWTRQQSPRALCIILMCGLLLGNVLCLATTWPAIAESSAISIKDLTAGNLDWRKNFLLDPSTEFIGFRADYLFLGVSALALLFWSVLASIPASAGQLQPIIRARSAALMAAFGVALTTPIAWPLYAIAPPLALMQFPWRWLPMASILAMAAIAFRLSASPAPWRWLSVALAVSAIGWWSVNVGNGLLETRPRTTAEEQQRVIFDTPRDTPEYRPRAVSRNQRESGEPLRASFASASSDRIVIKRLGPRISDTRWQVTAAEPGMVNLGIACFAGWTASIDQTRATLSCDERGLLQLPVQAGSHFLTLDFEATASRTAARAISGAAGLFWLALAASAWRVRRRNIGQLSPLD